RMADFARVLAAVDQVLGTTALPDYLTLRTRAAVEVVEGDEVATAIRRLMQGRSSWEGAAGELLGALTPERPSRWWPTTPAGMAAVLRRIGPALRAVDVDVTYRRSGGARIWLLEKSGETPSQPSQPSLDEQNPRSDGMRDRDGYRDGSKQPSQTVTPAADQTRRSEPRGDGRDGCDGSPQPFSADRGGMPPPRVYRCSQCGHLTAPTFVDMTGLPHPECRPAGRFQPIEDDR
ncbi:MAG TPA: hypothetical protein VGJ54_12255, partial [Streptosporangiaceae bacterium]